jgi:hypothetical protein
VTKRSTDVEVSPELRRHVLDLIDVTHGNAVARAAGVNHRTVGKIRLHEGVRVNRRIADVLAALTREQVTAEAAKSDRAVVEAWAVRDHIDWIRANVHGVSDAYIATAAGVAPSSIDRARSRGRVLRTTAERILAVTLGDVIDVIGADPNGRQVPAAPVIARLRVLRDAVSTPTHKIEDVHSATGIAATTLRALLGPNPPLTMPRFVADKANDTTIDDVVRCTQYRTRKDSAYARVDAGPAWAHVQAIMAETGVDRTAVARAAGVSAEVVLRLANGRATLRREVNDLVLAVRPEHAAMACNTVPARPARLHLATLFGQTPGLTPHAMEHLVDDSVIRRIMRMDPDRRIPRATAERILAITLPQAATLVRQHPRYRAEWIVRTSQALGWSLGWQARHLGYSGASPGWMTSPGPISDVNMRAVEAMREHIADRVATPANSGQSKGGIARAKGEAARAGWHVPAAYDDDMQLIAEAVRHRDSFRDAAEDCREEIIDRIIRFPYMGPAEIALSVGCSTDYAQKVRSRYLARVAANTAHEDAA